MFFVIKKMSEKEKKETKSKNSIIFFKETIKVCVCSYLLQATNSDTHRKGIIMSKEQYISIVVRTDSGNEYYLQAESQSLRTVPDTYLISGAAHSLCSDNFNKEFKNVMFSIYDKRLFFENEDYNGQSSCIREIAINDRIYWREANKDMSVESVIIQTKSGNEYYLKGKAGQLQINNKTGDINGHVDEMFLRSQKITITNVDLHTQHGRLHFLGNENRGISSPVSTIIKNRERIWVANNNRDEINFGSR